MANPPSSIAEKFFSEPASFPIGVLAPPTMTDPGISCLLTSRGYSSVAPERRCSPGGRRYVERYARRLDCFQQGCPVRSCLRWLSYQFWTVPKPPLGGGEAYRSTDLVG